MKKRYLAFFTKRTSDTEALIQGLESLCISVLVIDTFIKLMRLIRSKEIVILLVNDQSITKNDFFTMETFGLKNVKPFGNILIYGDPKKYSLSRTHDQIDFVINRNWLLAQKLEEIEMNWQSELIVLETENKEAVWGSGDSHIKRLEEDLTIKDRMISSLYMQVLEQRDRFENLYKRWDALPINHQQKEIRSFHRIMGSLTKRNQSWSDFLQHFEEVHPDFFKKLKQYTKTEISTENQKICAYIKMGLSNKQIANLIGILPTSVKQSQTRIKKKLRLPVSQTLRQFIKII